MKPSTELFNLVKSLSKSEKRFFKLTSSLQSGDKNYLKIFNAIEKQEEYDEENIKDLFKNETFIKHFPSEKNHLYKLVLKSLRSFHSDNNPGSILKQEVKNIEILYRKTLYKECGKFLSRAKKLAVDNEKFYYHIDLINWEKMLLEEAFESGEFQQDINVLIDEEQDVINKLTNLAQYQVLYSKINYVFRIGGFVKTDEEHRMVEEIAQDPLISDSSKALSNRAKSICYYVRGFCYSAQRNTALQIENFEKAKTAMDSNKKIRNDLPKRYIRAIANLIYGLLSQKRYAEAEAYLVEMNSLKDDSAFKTIDVQQVLFINKYMANLLLLNRQGKYEEASQLVEKAQEDLDVFGNTMNKEKSILFSYLFSYVYFGNGQMKEALLWINKVLNDNESTLRQDIYSYARVFNLMIHFELENFDLLEYIIKSTSRYLNKKNRDYEVESTVVDYIKRLAKKQSDESRLAIFKEMEEEVNTLFKDPNNRVILEYVDLNSWIKSKVQQRPFVELVQERGKA